MTDITADAESARTVGEARAAAQRSWLDAHASADPTTLHALAATRLAENVPRIESLTLSPDVLTGLLARLGGGAGAGGSAGTGGEAGAGGPAGAGGGADVGGAGSGRV